MYAKENMLENIKILIKALLYYKSKPQSSVRIEKEKSCTCRLKAKYVNLTPQTNSQSGHRCTTFGGVRLSFHNAV